MFLTVDPGSRVGGGTGIAIFSSDSSKVNPLWTFQLKGIAGQNWRESTDELLLQYRAILYHQIKDSKVYIEQPTFFDTHKGHTAARSDSLYKLIVTFGRLWEATNSYDLEVIPLAIVEWKGQLSKKQVSERVTKVCGKTYKGDIIDAVGMGLYVKGLF